MTKKPFLFAIITATMFACTSEKSGNTEEIIDEVPETLEIYGDSSISLEGAISTSEMLAMLDGRDSAEVLVSADILEICQKKGCWMDVDLGDNKFMTVRFKDYGFFVPMNAQGRLATMRGVAKVDTQSVDWLRHKAFDAGKSQEEIDAITEPVVKVSFLANGVILQ